MGSQDLIFGPAAGTVSPAAWHEAYQGDGGVREHWQYLLDSLGELGGEEFANRRQTLERILRDDGATYNDYSAGLTARACTRTFPGRAAPPRPRV